MKVGEYVRTNRGYIYKLGRYDEKEERWICYEDDDWFPVYESEVKISSPNIIDLIEVGDYVNGEQVSRIKQCPEYHLGDGILIFNEHNETIYSNFRTSKYYDIKSIVTKEAFERMEYRIGE